MTVFNILLAVCKIKICKKLKFHVKNDFSQNKLLLENVQLCLSKGTNWILMGNPFVATPPVRKAFCNRVVNSLKLSFPAHFKNIKNNISHNFYSFKLTVELLKIYIFFLLSVLSISINNYISRTNFGHRTGYFWNFLISHIIQNIWKKTSSIIGLSVSVLPWSISNCVNFFQFCKLPMTSNAYSLEEQTFGSKMATSGKFHSTYNLKQLKKRISFIGLSVSV